MSEEKKVIELKEEELEKVSGGADLGVDCADFSWRSGYAPTESTWETKGEQTIECKQCSHYQRPDGPCKLGH